MSTHAKSCGHRLLYVRHFLLTKLPAALTLDVYRHLWDTTIVGVLRKGLLAIDANAICHVGSLHA